MSDKGKCLIADPIYIWTHPYKRQFAHTNYTVLKIENSTVELVCELSFMGLGLDQKWISNRTRPLRWGGRDGEGKIKKWRICQL